MPDDIPEEFHSFELEGPFTECCQCHRVLADLEEPYVINKQIERGECVLEFALCITCHTQISSEMSEESRRTMQNFVAENADLETRAELHPGPPVAPYIANCVTCRADLATQTSYSLGGLVEYNYFQYGPYPLMVCGTCQSQLQEQLSKSTKDRWNRFIAENFDGPPAGLEPVPDRTPVLF